MDKKYRVEVSGIENLILIFRGHRVIIDDVLARTYGVSTGRLNQQFRRNRARFPEDFAFELTPEEFKSLMLQSATSKKGRGGRRKLPVAFTEHGAIMAAAILNSEIAVQASIHVVRAFVKLRSMLAAHKELARKLADLENKYDVQFKSVFDAIKQLMSPTPGAGPKKITGFKPSATQFRTAR